MKFLKLVSLLVVSVSMALIVNSCNETTTPTTDPQPKPSAVTNLMATSINATTVAVKFDASPSETNTLFKNYLLSVYETLSSTPQDFTMNAGTHNFTVNGLTEGKVYYFDVKAQYTNDSVSTSAVIQWSPATRFEKNVNDEKIYVYETASSFGSGLMMFDPAGGAPKVRTVANGGDWDLGLDTRDSKIIFGSATQLSYNYTGTPKVTQILTEYFNAATLNDVYDSKAMNAGDREAKYDDLAFDFTPVNPTTNTIFYVRKMDANNKYNYAKVMLIKNPSGAGYLQGNSPNRYVELQISYQKTAGVPYAKVAKNNVSK